jgi:N-acetylmuramic acid 6-phosphate etherase
VRAVGGALPALAPLVDAVARAIAGRGRLLYLGAGTSGRLAAADAAECPPTFGTPPSRVVALVAGGRPALARAVEGAEDDAPAGAAAVRGARASTDDVVIGVSASGRTPFVLAGLAEARRRGALTGLLTSNPEARANVDHLVLLDTGAERIAGSTRMKAGAAARMALTLLSSAAMIRAGRAPGGRMLDLRPNSDKLRARAVRLVTEATGATPARARRALARCGWKVRAAVADLGRKR